MNEKDTGNKTTQTIYELATEPTFIDRSNDPVQEISWEVADGQTVPLPPQVETVKEEVIVEKTKVPEEKIEHEEVHEQQRDSEIEDEEDVETEKKKKKNRISEKNRISQLTKELRQARAVNHDVLTRNQYLEAKVSQKDKEALTAQENYLTSQKERVKKYLTDALEEGDPAKIAEANDLLGQYNAQILLMNNQKQNVQESSPPSYNPQSYDDPIDNPYKEAGNEWMNQNTWANPNSPHFDQEMYEAADNYSIRLARKYKLEGKADEVGSPDFFDEITDYVKSSYDIQTPANSSTTSKPPAREKMQMKTDKSPPVGSVNRPTTHSDQPIRAKDVVLSPEQVDTALSLRGYVRDPKTGKPITDNNTLIEIYKRNLMRGNG